MLRITTTRTVLSFALLAVCAAGCNVDRLRGERRAPRGAPLADPVSLSRGGTAKAVVEIRPVAGEEVDLVEAVIEHRAMYHRYLTELRDYYKAHGYAAKQSWADFELDGIRKVKAFRYLEEAEVPQARLEPRDSIPEADALYERGLELMRKGGEGLPIFYRQKTMIQAAEVFRSLVELHPTSDKIDEAAFHLGEIHKEYLSGQEAIAVKWYERCWTWNPQTPHPARYQAAVVYDYRLHDRDRALELYKAVVQAEPGFTSNARFAQRRIGYLTDENRTAQAAGR